MTPEQIAREHERVDQRSVYLAPRCACGAHRELVSTMDRVGLAVAVAGWTLGRGTEFDRCPMCTPRAGEVAA